MTDHACAGAVCRLCDSRNVPISDREGYIAPRPAEMDPLAGPGQARRDDPETSQDAARFVRARATTHRVLIAWAFYDAGADGLTADAACLAAGLPIFPTEYTTRTSELLRLGVVALTGEHRVGTQGLDRQVYAITPYGRSLMEQRGDR